MMWSMINVRGRARLFRREPVFAMTVGVILALGVGLNIATFAVVRGVMLDRPAYDSVERLQEIVELSSKEATRSPRASTLAVVQSLSGLDAVTTCRTTSSIVRGTGDAQQVVVALGSDQFFRVFAARPLVGALPTVGDGGSIVISEHLWRSAFSADASVLGASLRVGRDVRSVAAIVPTSYQPCSQNGDRIDAWTTGSLAELSTAAAGAANVRIPMFTRVAEGEPAAQVAARLGSLGVSTSQWRLTLQRPGQRDVKRIASSLLALQSAAGFVLLLVLANMVNLTFVRHSKKQWEMVVRTALGASRMKLMVLLANEGLTLGVVGGLAASLIGLWTAPLIAKVAAPVLPAGLEVGVRWADMGFAVLASVVLSVVAAVIPGLSGARLSARASTAGTGGLRDRRPKTILRDVAVAAQMLIANIVITGAAVYVISWFHVMSTPTGFVASDLVVADVRVPVARGFAPPEGRDFARRLSQQLSSVGGQPAYALADGMPFSSSTGSIEWTVPSIAGGNSTGWAEVRAVSPSFFEVLGLRLVRGRGFTDLDSDGAESVVVVNEQFVRQYLHGSEPIGATLFDLHSRPVKIVGVISDSRNSWLTGDLRPITYLSIDQRPSGYLAVTTRSSDTVAVANRIRTAVKAIDPNVAILSVEPMSARILRSEERRFAYVALSVVFATLAGLISAFGVYAVAAHAAGVGLRDTAIRLSLGATRRSVTITAVRRIILPSLCGLIAALIPIIWIGRIISEVSVPAAKLEGVGASDPLVVAGISSFLALIALVSAWLPLYKATSVSLSDLLRNG